VNPQFAAIVGRTTEELARLDWMSITHTDDIRRGLENSALLDAGAMARFQFEKRYLRPDGAQSGAS